MQHIIILLIFTGAVTYILRLAIKAFKSQECASGCEKCSAVDFKKLEQQLKDKGL